MDSLTTNWLQILMYSLLTRAWWGEGSFSSSISLVMYHLLKCFSRGRDSLFILYNYITSPHHKWVLILFSTAIKFDSSDNSLTCNSLYFGFQTFFPGSPFPPQHCVPPSTLPTPLILVFFWDPSFTRFLLNPPSLKVSSTSTAYNTFMLSIPKSFNWACCCLLACISNHISPVDFPYASQTL